MYSILFLEPSVQVAQAPDYLEQMSDLSTVERHGASAFLKAANEDSKANVTKAVKSYRIDMKNEYECPPIGVRLSLDSLTFLSFFHISGSNSLSRRW